MRCGLGSKISQFFEDRGGFWLGRAALFVRRGGEEFQLKDAAHAR